MTSIGGLALSWDDQDRLRTVDLGGGGTAYYVYDTSGQRVRKVIDDQHGVRRQDRVYVGDYELYRQFGAGALTRESLDVVDDKRRVALVERTTTPTVEAQILRYQYANQVDSAFLELDGAGEPISYEQYHPYGTSSFQAGRTAAESVSSAIGIPVKNATRNRPRVPRRPLLRAVDRTVDRLRPDRHRRRTLYLRLRTGQPDLAERSHGYAVGQPVGRRPVRKQSQQSIVARYQCAERSRNSAEQDRSHSDRRERSAALQPSQ